MNSDDPDYLDEDGNVRMCKTCRSVKVIKDNEKWIVDTMLYTFPPDNVVFEVCPRCSEE